MFPSAGLLSFLISPKTQIKLNRPLFHTENVRVLSKSAVFAPWTYAPPVVGGIKQFQIFSLFLLYSISAIHQRFSSSTLEFSLF